MGQVTSDWRKHPSMSPTKSPGAAMYVEATVSTEQRCRASRRNAVREHDEIRRIRFITVKSANNLVCTIQSTTNQ
ncbi:hypothetical protein BgiBS90_008378 [Biomphalaria glabrata]|nr:hypothetical protein BgiBS90_008378 [Biomphalaria glabrata]